jgi:hypothetical protein
MMKTIKATDARMMCGARLILECDCVACINLNLHEIVPNYSPFRVIT